MVGVVDGGCGWSVNSMVVVICGVGAAGGGAWSRLVAGVVVAGAGVGCAGAAVGGDGGLGGVHMGQKSGRMCPWGQVAGGGLCWLSCVLSAGVVLGLRGSLFGGESVVVAG